MAMRLSGLVSGMDTDAMIEELVSAYSKKKDKVFKQKKTLEYKKDAWQELNSKVYSFYTGKLGNMQLTSNYNLKTTKSSNENKAAVTASSIAVNGTQELKIKQLAKTGYLTGGKINTKSGGEVTESTKLSELGIKASRLEVKVGGETKTLDLEEGMSIKELKAKISDMGLNANFDAANGRFFISSKTGGEANDFSITGMGKDGADALAKLGLSTVSKTAIDNYKKIAALDIETSAKNDYMRSVLTNSGEQIKSQIEALKEKETDGSITDDERDELALLQDQIKDIDALVEESDLTNMEDYATNILQMSIDYSDANAEYTSYVDLYNNDVAYAKDMVDYAELYEKSKSEKLSSTDQTRLDSLVSKYGEMYSKGATKIDGQDAIIELNGAEFTGNSNNFQINGLTINAKGLTDPDEVITITTDTDVDAIYDKIKDFFKDYNELMTEMSTKYNAASAGDYEPLTEEEEEELSEKQLEKWEKILTTAALRRDSTLSSVMSSMKNALSKSYEIGGKTYSLSTFGIKTLSYFNAEDNEKGNFHIDGDKDDKNVAGNPDKLKAALVSDPENTIEFFASAMKDLYKSLNDKMAKSTSTHSAFKLYNDKTIQSQYDGYTKKLSEWEKKIDKYRDNYVKKFSRMETAMAKLQSQTSAMASFFGGTTA